MKRTPRQPRKPRPDLHDCAKGQMHHPFAQKVMFKTPTGFIA